MLEARLKLWPKIAKPKPSLYDEESAEQIFYRMYGCRATKGTLGSAIAYALSCRKLDAELWHESENLLENREGYFPPTLFQAMLSEHREYIRRGGFAVRSGMRIDADAMIAALTEERLLIVQCLIDGDADGMHDRVLHWILVFDFRDGEFLAYDPLYVPTSAKASNYIRIGNEEMEALIKTPLGASVISVGERKA